jgi:quinol monooxygenase YgiN
LCGDEIARHVRWIWERKRKESSRGYFFREARERKSVTDEGILHLTDWRILEMAKFALYAELKAKPGKEADVEAFLKQGAQMAKAEAGTVHWYGFKEDKGGVFGVFDTFNDEAGRDAHLNGEIAKELMANAETLFSEAPKIHKIELIGEK